VRALLQNKFLKTQVRQRGFLKRKTTYVVSGNGGVYLCEGLPCVCECACMDVCMCTFVSGNGSVYVCE